MKKSLICALICVPLFTGCASTSDNAATLDRDQAVSELTVKMDNLGYNPVTIQPGVDEFLNMAAAILERQRNVIGEYRKQTENFRDVQAFLYAYKDATPEELELAIAEFDAGAKTEEEKIAPKINAYSQANENVYNQNVELTKTLMLEMAKSAYILSEHGTAVAQATAVKVGQDTLNVVNGYFGNKEEKEEDPQDLGTALLKATDQLSLALEANEIIDLEKETIDAVKQLQQEQEAKS
ncbi:hypothetical protein AB4160_09845 [Shewanella sp. 10N.286.51.B8]|uniref:hypothetical protein n=1 Tax=Shewanella sp. 10N.286.51.B8 TaxID=3229708 RepID=UPI0035542EB7